MAMNHTYTDRAPTRDAVDTMRGPVVIEFGTAWCGYCRAAQDDIAAAFDGHESVEHLKIEDGPGRKLGRSFRVKLWPTLIFMRDGVEVERLVRPASASPIRIAMDKIVWPDRLSSNYSISPAPCGVSSPPLIKGSPVSAAARFQDSSGTSRPPLRSHMQASASLQPVIARVSL